jgi:4-oxalocrotonate tautomerase/trans-3-chloroacrylic acid dehalogenase beta subunit
MPMIQCHIATGMSPDNKRRLVSDLVDATSRTLGADPRTVTVIIHEHDAANIRMLDFAPRGAVPPHGNAEDG